MKRILLAVACVLGLSPAIAVDEAPAPRDMVVLTVSGLVGKTNRGPFDPKLDSMLALQKVDFKNAFAFDRATLVALPQGTVTVHPPEFDKPTTFSGPLLREVLGYLEAAQVRITFVAMNGYIGWLDPDDIKSSDWILALSADGVPLGLGQQGPIWLLNTRSPDFKPDDTRHGHWVWAVFYMRIGD
jgi:hypothetical protein